MSKTTEERIESALSQLLSRLLPVYPGEDEAVADDRFEEAYNYAIEVLDSAGDSPLSSDVNHASDLIKKKLLRENSSPEKALRFTNLYSRLLSQPVLNQKWAMLYFLHQLADADLSTFALEMSNSHPILPSGSQPSPEVIAQSPVSPQRYSDKQFVVDSPAFNEAFSKPGLLKLPVTGEPKMSRLASTEKPERPSRVREKRAAEAAKPEEAAPQTPPVPKTYGPMQPSEPSLLRDLPFTLQGLSSTNLTFASSAALKLPPTLPVPLISLLHTLAEPSLLYRGLAEFVESTEGGLVGQSFRSALGKELRAYLGLVATLEGQIRRAMATLDESAPRQGIGNAGVTLKRCVIWTREATIGLRLMKLLVEESMGKKGGELISLIHSYSLNHGDPFVQAFAERLLSHVTRPFYDMLRKWIYDGELEDPYLEFLVSEQPEDEDIEGDGKKGGATSVWEEKYKLDQRMIPTIITEEFANKVFLIGKTLNFIRYGCGDAAWVESYSKDASKELRYGDTAKLERSIDEAYKTTMARLIQLMADKFMLFEHLQALKKYLLLGEGDFIQILMESLATNLDRPAITQYRHTLTAQLEHAVRNSNAQYDNPEVLRRLDARMLELSHGEIGWDVFTLEYKIDAPVDVIVTPYGSKQYLKVFNFLWRIKRVEFALGSTWRSGMTGARGILGSISDKLGSDWKLARCVVSEMIHFISQLQYYILFEVIERSWDELKQKLHKPESTLDDMISAHAHYLNSITRKGLLGSHGGYDFTVQLHELLKIMLSYKDAVDGLYSFSVAEFTRRQERSAKIETRTAAGKWGLSEKDEQGGGGFETPASTASLAKEDKKKARETDSPFPFPAGVLGLLASSATNEDDVLDSLRKRLSQLSLDFRARVNTLLGDLQSQPDPDMKFLGMVMNWNDVYKPIKRSRRGKTRDKDGKEVAPTSAKEGSKRNSQWEAQATKAEGEGKENRPDDIGKGKGKK